MPEAETAGSVRAEHDIDGVAIMAKGALQRKNGTKSDEDTTISGNISAGVHSSMGRLCSTEPKGNLA